MDHPPQNNAIFALERPDPRLWTLYLIRSVLTGPAIILSLPIFYFREITFTFANIQNLSVTQGPIQRLLGIADLKVETAGGGSGAGKNPQAGIQQNLHTAYFRGIDNAEEVKQLIAARMRSHRDAGLGDTDDSAVPVLLPTRSETSPADSTTSVLSALQAVLEEAKAIRRSVGAGN